MDGKAITGLPSHKVARHGLVRTFQNVRLFKQLTVLENLLVAQHTQVEARLLPGLLKLKSYRQSEADALARARNGWTSWACASSPTARPATWPMATSAAWRSRAA